jgi:hypothetical protein
LKLLTPGEYCAFVVDLGNYGRNSITPRMIFEELRKTSFDDFTFTHYHRRRSGNFILQVHAATTATLVEGKISNAINRVASAKLNRTFGSIFRDLVTLRTLMENAREKTDVAPGSSDVVKDGRPMKVAAVFIESKGERSLETRWPKEIDKRVEILGTVGEEPSTLVALYERPREGGDFGYVANAVTRFYGRSGIIVRSTARALSVVDDIASGRLKS